MAGIVNKVYFQRWVDFQTVAKSFAMKTVDIPLFVQNVNIDR